MSNIKPTDSTGHPPYRLPLARWHEGLYCFSDPAEKQRFYSLVDAVEAVVASIRRAFPTEPGATLEAHVFPRRGVGRIIWRHGDCWIDWRIACSK